MIPTPFVPSGHFPLIGGIGLIGPHNFLAKRRKNGPDAPQNFLPITEIFLYSQEKLWYAVRA